MPATKPTANNFRIFSVSLIDQYYANKTSNPFRPQLPSCLCASCLAILIRLRTASRAFS